MKTIEDLKFEQTFYNREKDLYGNVTRTPYQKMVPRKPNVVSQGVRFGYFMIDLVFIYIIQALIGVIIALILISSKSPSIGTLMMINMISSIANFSTYFLYYAIFEGFAGGTPGKLICGYTVIDKQAERVSFPVAMLRSICRFVPFEAFSCFGDRGWHDKWSNTYVVKKSERDELRKLLGKMSDDLGIID